MFDPLANALARLAPDVDPTASREVFERARDAGAGGEPSPTRDRWMLAAACVLLLVAGVAGIWVLAGGGGDDRAPAAPPADGTTEPTTADSAPPRGDGTEFRLIAMEPVGDFDRRGIDVADTRAELDELLAGYRESFDRYAGDVDPRSEVAVVIERPDNSCPVEFDRFTPVGDAWRVEWSENPAGACPDIGLGWVYLLAVDRSALDGVTSIVLPAEQLGSTELPELSAAVPVTAPPEEPVVERPPVPAPQELEARLARFPMPNEFDPEGLAALIAAHGRGEDWTGTVSGVLFHAVNAGEWWLCFEILESFPEQCGTGLRLLDAPALYLAQPGLFDEQRSEDTGPVAVVISRGSHAVVGTWFDDAAIFVEHGTQSPTTIEPTTAPTTAPTSAPEATSPSPQVLHTGLWPSGPRDRTIEVALSGAEFESMWARWVDPAEPRPGVDLDRFVVVAFETGGGPCPQRFDHLQQSGPVWTPMVVEDQEGRDDCAAEIALSWVNVVQIERSVLGRSATVSHPSGRSGVQLDELDRPPGRRNDVPVVAEAVAPLGTIVAAQDQATYTAMWEQLGPTGQPPRIDFDSHIAVAFVIPDDACPPVFTGFGFTLSDPPLWMPRFVETETVCRLPLISRLFVIAVDRSTLGTGVTFLLPADDTYGFPEQRYEVRLT